ncbi:MAG: tripartite tricarboxylate transporter TctB family protein [Mycobacterium sp.]
MARDTEQPTGAAPAGTGHLPDPQGDTTTDRAVGDTPLIADHDGQPVDSADAPPSEHDRRLTQRVHILLGLVVAAAAAWMLYRSSTELPFYGGNNEPGPGYLPVLLTVCLIGLGLLLSAVWAFGPRARSGEAPTLSLGRNQIARALLVWLALVICTALLDPLGFLVAGEVLVLFVILVVERMRSIPSIVTLLLLPPLMYFVFEILLEVRLPVGTLWQ